MVYKPDIKFYNVRHMKSFENPVTKSELGYIARERKETFHEEQRRSFGIPLTLNESPVLYMGAHRGVFNTEYEGHMLEFKRIMKGGEVDTSDKESAYIDLSKSDSGAVVELLRYMVLKTDPSREQKMLSSPSGKNEALPGYLTYIIFLPALDENGGAVNSEPSRTFAIDAGNYETLLPQLGEFLKEKGTVSQPTNQIEDKTVADSRKMIE